MHKPTAATTITKLKTSTPNNKNMATTKLLKYSKTHTFKLTWTQICTTTYLYCKDEREFLKHTCRVEITATTTTAERNKCAFVFFLLSQQRHFMLTVSSPCFSSPKTTAITITSTLTQTSAATIATTAKTTRDYTHTDNSAALF